MSTAYDEDTELYTCGICGWYTSDDWGDVAEHRETWHTDW